MIVHLDPVQVLGLSQRTVKKGEPGPWTRSVTGIDTSQRGGYSFIGGFMRAGVENYEVGALYLDCEFAGPPGSAERVYRLFCAEADGRIKVFGIARGSQWAQALHPIAQAVLAGQQVDSVVEAATDTSSEAVRGVRADALEMQVAEEVAALRGRPSDGDDLSAWEARAKSYLDALAPRLLDLRRWADQGNEAAKSALAKITIAAQELREEVGGPEARPEKECALPAIEGMLAGRAAGHEVEAACYLLRQALRQSSEEKVRRTIGRALSLLGDAEGAAR